MPTESTEETEKRRAIIWWLVVIVFAGWVAYAFASRRVRKLPIVRSFASQL